MKNIVLILCVLFLCSSSYAGNIDKLKAVIAAKNAGVADVTAPTWSSTTVAADGDTVTVVFSENLNDTALGGGEFDLDCDGAGGADNVLVYASGDGTATWVFTSTTTIESGETCNQDFDGAANEAEDDSGNDLADFTDEIVTNNSTQGGAPAGEGSADFSDDFTGADLSAWNGLASSFTLDTGADNVYGSSGDNLAAMSYGTNSAGVNQYVHFPCSDVAKGCGAVLRSTGTGSDGFYAVYWYSGPGPWYWERWTNSGYDTDCDTTASCAPSNGEDVGVTIQGTGNDTVVKIWNNPTNNYAYDVNNWDSASDAADCTFTGNPVSAEDTGLQVGLGQFGDATYGNWTGGSFD